MARGIPATNLPLIDLLKSDQVSWRGQQVSSGKHRQCSAEDRAALTRQARLITVSIAVVIEPLFIDTLVLGVAQVIASSYMFSAGNQRPLKAGSHSFQLTPDPIFCSGRQYPVK